MPALTANNLDEWREVFLNMDFRLERYSLTASNSEVEHY